MVEPFGGVFTYSHSATNLNTLVLNPQGDRTTWQYDANSRVTVQRLANQRLQIASAGGGTTTNTWDFENRLTKVALPSGVLNTFTYNGDAIRVQRQDSSGTLKQIWDHQKIVEETDQTNVVQVIYTHSDGLYGDLVSQRRSGVSLYFLFDPLRSTSRLMDGSQNVTDVYLYKSFGEIFLKGTDQNPFQFVGASGYYQCPDLTFTNARTRVLFPALARWLTLDPLSLTAGANLYRYVDNNPVQFTDPSGMASALGQGPLFECAVVVFPPPPNALATVECIQGRLEPIILKPIDPRTGRQLDPCVLGCYIYHEDIHVAQFNVVCPSWCSDPCSHNRKRPQIPPVIPARDWECPAYLAERKCLLDFLMGAGAPFGCSRAALLESLSELDDVAQEQYNCQKNWVWPLPPVNINPVNPPPPAPIQPVFVDPTILGPRGVPVDAK